MESRPWWRRVLGWVGIAVVALGCQEQPPKWVLSRARVVGSGCSAFGCVSQVVIVDRVRHGRVCHLNSTKLNPGDTVLVKHDGEFCAMY